MRQGLAVANLLARFFEKLLHLVTDLVIALLDAAGVEIAAHLAEHIIVAISDLSRTPEPWMICTGDFVLVGDIARPDLAQSAAEGAGELFDKALPRVAGLPDHVGVYPGHVGGST